MATMKRKRAAKADRKPKSGPARATFVFHEVTRERWGDMERLFEARGGPKSCWCMVWRATPEEARRTDGASRKAALKKRVEARIPIGLLGYLDGEPVAWCSIAPRETYRDGLAEVSEEDAPGDVWSLACFFALRSVRGRGVFDAALEAAKAHAKKRGARILEAYPVDPESPSYRFMGFLPKFEQAGFVEVGRAGTRRHVVRFTLR